MIQFWSIAKNTFIQTIRQPIFGVMIFLTFVMLVLSLPMSGWTMGNAGSGDYEASDQQMLENLGLSTLLLMGLITAALSASATISREIEDKTALTVVSKPVSRAVFVLGKFAGVGLAITLMYYLGAAVFLLTVRHGVVSSASVPINWPVVVFGCVALAVAVAVAGAGNFMFGWTFVSAGAVTMIVTLTAALGGASIIDTGWKLVPISQTFGPENIRPELLVAMFMIYLAVVLLSAVAVAASTRVGQILTLLITLAVLAAGSMHDWLVASANRLAGAEVGSDAIAAKLLSYGLVNLTFFYPLDALARGWAMPGSLVWLKVLYFACYTAAVLALGIAMFQRRQIAAAETSSSMPPAVSLLSGGGRIVAIIALIFAGVLLTQRSSYDWLGLVRVAGILASGGVCWIICGALGSGRKWAFWATILAAGCVAGAGLTLRFIPAWTSTVQTIQSSQAAIIATLISAATLIVLILPKTRKHFRG